MVTVILFEKPWGDSRLQIQKSNIYRAILLLLFI